MIRNENQLRNAQEMLDQINKMIQDVREDSSSRERTIRLFPLQRQRRKLEEEIEEYTFFHTTTLEDAILERLSEPRLLEDVVEVLVKLRLAAGLTQEELGNRLKWQQSNLSRFESRTSPTHTLAKVIEYAAGLGVYLHVTPSLREETTNADMSRYLPVHIYQSIAAQAQISLLPEIASAGWLEGFKKASQNIILLASGISENPLRRDPLPASTSLGETVVYLQGARITQASPSWRDTIDSVLIESN